MDHSLHIQPYRTLDNVIEGAVISFVDITEIRHATQMLSRVNEIFHLAVIDRDTDVAVTVQDLNGRILVWSPGATRMYGWSQAEALGMNIRDRVPEKTGKEALARIKPPDPARVPEPHLTQMAAKDSSAIDVWITATPLLNEAGRMYAIATTERKADTMEP